MRDAAGVREAVEPAPAAASPSQQPQAMAITALYRGL